MRRVLLLAALAAVCVQAAGAAPTPVLKIVFPEGWSAGLMADRAAEVRLIAIRERGVTPRLSGSTYAAAARTARAPAPFRPLLTRRSIEGFLFPSTYFFEPSTSAASLVARQIATFEQRWKTIDLRPARARKRTQYDVLTIASLVEKEAALAAERPLVAAVIFNRLERGMPLAIDASLRYGLGVQGTKSLTAAHLRSNTPYNTHRFKGLPPTPITNPGLPSMRAAAKPATVDYLYYLRKPNSRSHFFTADEAEFCAKALEYGYEGC